MERTYYLQYLVLFYIKEKGRQNWKEGDGKLTQKGWTVLSWWIKCDSLSYAIAYNQALCIRRTCSTDNLKKRRSSDLRKHIFSRGHSELTSVYLAILCWPKWELKKSRPRETPWSPNSTLNYPNSPQSSMTIWIFFSKKLRSAIPENPMVAFRGPKKHKRHSSQGQTPPGTRSKI